MTQWIIDHFSGTGYFGIFLLMMLENIIPPVPSEAIMGLGGIAAARGQMDPFLLVAVGTAGTVLGNLFWWEIGRRLGYERLQPFVERHGRWLTMEWRDVERIHHYFDRYGGITVFVFRFLPFGRTMISLPAGLMRMPFTKFTLFTTAGSVIWNSALVAVGYWAHSTMDQIDDWLGPVMVGFIALAVLAYLWRVITWKPKA